MKYKLNILENLVRNTEVIIETDMNEDELDEVLDMIEAKISTMSYDDYTSDLSDRGIKILEVNEGDIEPNEVACDDLMEVDE